MATPELIEPVETPAPAPSVWTTPPDSDQCTEYRPAQAPPHSQFSSREECEEWVGKRKCRPGYGCSDGCNYQSCDGTGMKLYVTEKACMVFVLGSALHYKSKAVKPSEAPDWDEVARATAKVFRVPERKLVIYASSIPDEAPTKPAADWLSRSRAELVRRELVSRGVDPKRIVVVVRKPSEMGSDGYYDGQVAIGVEPSGVRRADFGPDDNDPNLCWVKYPQNR